MTREELAMSEQQQEEHEPSLYTQVCGCGAVLRMPGSPSGGWHERPHHVDGTPACD